MLTCVIADVFIIGRLSGTTGISNARLHNTIQFCKRRLCSPKALHTQIRPAKSRHISEKYAHKNGHKLQLGSKHQAEHVTALSSWRLPVFVESPETSMRIRKNF